MINTIAEVEPSVLAAITDGRCTRGIRPPTVYTIGPVVAIAPPIQLANECLRWLDSQPTASVLFICLGGGGGYFSTQQVHDIARGLERSGHRFLWVLRGPPEPGSKLPTDANLAELLPAGFLEKTKERGLVWPTRAPQKEILAHAAVGGFVTHCGWNSIVESLWFGVPMLPWPNAAEQHFNAYTLVAEMRVAVAMKVDKKRNNFVEAAELERAVKALMDDSEAARKVRDKSVEMKAACRMAVEEGGSSVVSLQRLRDALIQGAVHPKK
jgi:UDP-N-acetylglucosamine:LPS N-acetylglucosamine transferase